MSSAFRAFARRSREGGSLVTLPVRCFQVPYESHWAPAFAGATVFMSATLTEVAA